MRLSGRYQPIRSEACKRRVTLETTWKHNCRLDWAIECSSSRFWSICASTALMRWIRSSIARESCPFEPEFMVQLRSGWKSRTTESACGNRIKSLRYFLYYKTKWDGYGAGHLRSIIELHDGRLWPQGDGVPGTTFCFTLPVPDHPTSEPQAGCGGRVLSGPIPDDGEAEIGQPIPPVSLVFINEDLRTISALVHWCEWRSET